MPSTQSQADLRPSPKTAFVSRRRPNNAYKAGKFLAPSRCAADGRDRAESLVFAITPSSLDETAIGRPFLSPSDSSEDPDSWPAVGAAGKGAKRPARPLRAGTAAGRSYPFFLPTFSSEVLAPWFADRTKETRPKRGLIRLHSALNEFVGPAGAPSRSHSSSLDHRRRPEMLRTAIATAFFWPTITTSRLPRVTPV
jgi:hypothetical protein